MPTILDRYIFREITIPFVLGMAAFTGALLMGRFLKIADMVVAKGVPLSEICLLIAYLFPSFALVTIPMAFLLAVLLAFGRLSSDSEIIAIKASGVGLGRLMLPVMAFALLASFATAATAIYAVPAGNTAFKNLLTVAVENRAEMEIKERVFIDSIPGLVIYVDQYDQATRGISGIMIQDDRNLKEPVTIFAEKGTVTSDPAARQVQLLLSKGSIHSIKESRYRLIGFSEYEMTVRLNQTIRSINRNELDMTIGELKAAIDGGATDLRQKREMELEFHRRFATPFACFVFALAGVPLGIQNSRSGKGSGFAVSIGLLIIYYIVLSACKALGDKGVLHAAIAMWMPNLCFLLLGIWFFRRSANELPILGKLAPSALADMFRRLLYRNGSRR